MFRTLVRNPAGLGARENPAGTATA